jgi:hypothetical protein
MMTKRQLIEALEGLNVDDDYEIHLDVSCSDEYDWEGDRVVRHLAGVRIQHGFQAVALDAAPFHPNTPFKKA